MAFPRRLLNPGEVVVVDVRQHWWYLSRPVSAVVIVLAGGIAALTASAPEAADAIVLAVLVAGLLWLLVRYVKWATISLVVTSRRIVRRGGFLRRQTREIPIDQLSDISVTQSLFERLIGAGSLVLESAGSHSREVLPCLPHPASIQNEIYNQRASGPAGRLSVPEQLEKLDELRRRGIISNAEFVAEKDRLLDRY